MIEELIHSDRRVVELHQEGLSEEPIEIMETSIRLLLHGRGDNQHRPQKLKVFEGELMGVKLEVAEMVKVRSGSQGPWQLRAPLKV